MFDLLRHKSNIKKNLYGFVTFFLKSSKSVRGNLVKLEITGGYGFNIFWIRKLSSVIKKITHIKKLEHTSEFLFDIY